MVFLIKVGEGEKGEERVSNGQSGWDEVNILILSHYRT